MTKEELDVQKEIEEYFTESAGFGRDKIQNFMDIVNKALKQKGGRIEELEQENAELKEQMALMQDAECSSCTTLGGMQIKIDDIEKENTELKKRLKEHEKVGNAQFWVNVWSWKAKAEQLTKAKDIIKCLLTCCRNYPQENADKMNQAEQFLKDEGCPDCFCEDCTKDCGIKEFGLVEVDK